MALSEIEDEDSEEYQYAKKVMMVCILSIMVTAPTGAILISLTGSKLLTKTNIPIIPEEWRRSHRPSIRDISIIDEEEEREDIESVSVNDTPERKITNLNTNNHNYKLGGNSITPIDT